MSFAPVFATASASAPVKVLIGSNPVRLYPAAEAPAKGATGYALPYCTYQQIAGGPENYLNQSPDIDGSIVQVDVYGETVTSARAAFVALRNALQSSAYITSVREDGRDPDTNNVRISFDVEWLTPR